MPGAAVAPRSNTTPRKLLIVLGLETRRLAGDDRSVTTDKRVTAICDGDVPRSLALNQFDSPIERAAVFGLIGCDRR